MRRLPAFAVRPLAMALLLPLTPLTASFAVAAPEPSAESASPGRLLERGERPPDAGPRACSFRHPLCVASAHGANAAPSALLATLASAERAWGLLTGALAFAAPDPDPDTRAYDLYVVPSRADGAPARTFVAGRDVRSRVDRASAFTVLDQRLAEAGGCALDAVVAREVARAALLRAAPATDEGTARAQASYLARLVVPCALGDDDGVSTFQAHPERAIADTWEDDPRTGEAFDRGAALVYWWLDASYGAEPGSIVRALWALSATQTPLGAARWHDEPDAFDALRVTFKGALTTGSTVDDLYLELAAARAHVAGALPEARPLGNALTPRIDWTVDWPATPRRLALPLGVAPTGAAYVKVRHSGAPPGARLRVEATWEEHAKMRIVALKIDAAGRPIGEVLFPVTERATEAQGTVVDLDAADAVLLAIANAGDPLYPFDPDDAVFEPHGLTVTIAAE